MKVKKRVKNMEKRTWKKEGKINTERNKRGNEKEKKNIYGKKRRKKIQQLENEMEEK